MKYDIEFKNVMMSLYDVIFFHFSQKEIFDLKKKKKSAKQTKE